MFARLLLGIMAGFLLPVAATAEPLVPLAVLPFTNVTRYQGHLLDRRAAAAIVVEARTPWAPVDPALVQRTLEGLNAPSPLGTAEAQALCRRLPAALALQGAISLAEVEAGSARVRLHVELLEPLSGEVTARAQGEGRAQSREPLPRDQLLEQALQRAARSVMQALVVPRTVGQIAEPRPDKPLRLTLIPQARVEANSVLLLYAPLSAPEGEPEEGPAPAWPLAAVAVQRLAEGGAELRLLGQHQAPAGGEIAVWVGRLP